ncbi:flagellar basal body L-ring protein FlgH [Azomonas macrocytogenes]|uniref:Flagellar L-ring protein n=1 Tax=Azomonas macrocytogenes TaxID=69962 RepID=A0A839T6F4_AZOMA|nr:flagellar basal body L-ring protein FlgH [Azomonas macrocytogenes]MBB3105002.1 flagellar L-ring protein precursor FlgH [Azomonas macrocytogenes]
MNRLSIAFALLSTLLVAGCVGPTAKPNDPYYAPVLPRTPIPAAQTSGAIYQAGFDQSLFNDRRARRVGDVITITLSERTQARKTANSELEKNSDASLSLGSLFGSKMSGKNPISGSPLSFSADYSGTRQTDGSADADQSNSLTGSITVTVAEVMPNGVMLVRGEKWMTLNTGDELIRISGLIRTEDIMPDNTVSSNRVADARITYSGTGAFADASQPGWFDRLLMSPLMPF